MEPHEDLNLRSYARKENTQSEMPSTWFMFPKKVYLPSIVFQRLRASLKYSCLF
jgi:hypothetical protein